MNIIEQAAARRAAEALAKAGETTSTDRKEPTPETPKIVKSDTPAPKGAFKSLELTRFVKQDGSWCNAKDGYFQPVDQEEYDTLQYYATKYNLVELPTEE